MSSALGAVSPEAPGVAGLCDVKTELEIKLDPLEGTVGAESQFEVLLANPDTNTPSGGTSEASVSAELCIKTEVGIKREPVEEGKRSLLQALLAPRTTPNMPSTSSSATTPGVKAESVVTEKKTFKEATVAMFELLLGYPVPEKTQQNLITEKQAITSLKSRPKENTVVKSKIVKTMSKSDGNSKKPQMVDISTLYVRLGLDKNPIGHLRKKHKGESYQCSYCGKAFNIKDSLVRHIRMHSGDKPYRCSHCSKAFSQKYHLKTHMRTHTGEKPYQCAYCSKAYVNNSRLTIHVRTHTGEKPYRCSHCSKTFKEVGNLKLHIKMHTGDKKYQCSYCDRSFIQNYDLTKHLTTHTGEKSYQCKFCGKAFNRKGNLTIHLRTHTGEKPYQCSHCSKAFSVKTSLTSHIRTHTGEKPYRCNYCTKSVNTSSHLKTHIMTAHTREKPYQCCHCFKGFTKKGYLVTHLSTHEGK